MSEAIALVGDWNATPHDRGRWSPSWLAARAGLTIRSSGPGKHGDIDYPMADCRLANLERHHAPVFDGSRSDHDIVTFHAFPPSGSAAALPDGLGTTLAIGTWNLLHGRPPHIVKRQVSWVLRNLELDVLVCQEAAEYHEVLAALPGWRLVAFEGHGKMHNVILVREPLSCRRPKLWRLSLRGWRVVTGGRHAPLYATSVVVAGWLRVVCVHQPPSVNWRRGVIYGPPMRVAATVMSARTLRRRTLASQRSRHH